MVITSAPFHTLCGAYARRAGLSRGDAESAEAAGRDQQVMSLPFSAISAISASPRETPRQETHRAALKALDEITGIIVDAAVRIHRDLGPGLLESVYESTLERTLLRHGLGVARQLPIHFVYDGATYEDAFRVDLLVENRVIVEVKSVERVAVAHRKQLLTYLRLANVHVGLLVNFGAATLKEGLHRIVNDLPPSASPRLRVNRGIVRS